MSVMAGAVDTRVYNVFLSLWQFISLKRRRQFKFLFILTVFSSCSEMMSLGIALPFISVVIDPDKVFALPIMAKVVAWLKITSSTELIIPLTLAFSGLALLAGLLRLILIWSSLWLSNAIGTDLGIDIYRKTLYQPYRVHVARNSSEIISGITQKISMVTSIIVSGTTFITSLILFFVIMVSMLVIEPGVSIAAAACFGVIYSLIARNTRTRLTRNGQVIARQQTAVMRALQEGLGAIRDVLLDGTQEGYLNIYRSSVVQLQQARTENTFMNQAPRYVIETLAMVLVAFFVLLMNHQSHEMSDVLPMLGFLALCAQRLLPIMQQVYGNWSEVAGNKAVLGDVLALLSQPLPEDVDQPVPLPLQLNSEIRLYNISFRYSVEDDLILDKVNLTIPKGARLGIIGKTGGGKSTMLDLLMGLLEPVQGEFLVDGEVITAKNRRAWQRTIAHVPQVIFLTDLSIAENIAFGVPSEQIDYIRVREAAVRANAHEFIDATPKGYDTFVGERGIRLSGGQRQRIGIARALYKQASVLCFDEATSALDTNTEHEVMEAINNLDNTLTIIIIAHRLTTLKNCTHFVKLTEGKMKHISTYSEIEMETC